MNLLKVDITYTINEPRIIKNGVDEPFPRDIDITIDEPILVSTVLVADKSKTYIVTNSKVSNNFFLKSDIDIKISDNGLISSIESDIEDNSIDFAENLIVSTAKIAKNIIIPSSLLNDIGPNGEALQDLREIQQSILKINKKEDLELALKKVEFYKNQIEWFNNNFKVYIRKNKVKYSIVIDPMEIYKKTGAWSELIGKNIKHNIFPKHIFPDNSILKDTISLEIPKTCTSTNSIIKDGVLTQGILYRTPSNVNIDVTSNGSLLANNSLYLAQFGKVSMIPVDSKRAGKKKTSLVFSPKTGSLTNQMVETSSSSEKLSKSIKNSVESVNQAIEYLKFEAQIKELEKQKSIKNLKETLEEPIDDIEDPETEFEKQIRAAKEKQKLLELELLIKQIQKQIKELESEK